MMQSIDRLPITPAQEERRFFGSAGPLGILRPPKPSWYRLLKMTATAIMYTSEGFAIAADGKQYWAHEPTRDMARSGESDHAQKIFFATGTQSVLAYVIRGDIANLDRSFNVEIELRQQMERLCNNRFKNYLELSNALAGALERYIKAAKD